MLSRRSVRIKVMQLLYALSRDEALTFEDVRKRYWTSIEDSYEVFLFNVYNFIQVAKAAAGDEATKKAKHLPSDFDKAFTAILCENELVMSLRDSKELQKIFEKKGFAARADRDQFKSIYNEFAKTEAYTAYVLKADKEKQDHVEILLELYRFCRKNELFVSLMEDAYINWIDDKSLVIGALKKVVKALPVSGDDFLSHHYPDDETVKEYGEELLTTTAKGDAVLMDMIQPLLENWDKERLAVVDTIILKMAASEFLNFPTIPVKVTLNEYVDIAKLYSTDKSKEFINGVLDRLMKILQDKGEINKEGRGLEG